MPSQDGVVNQFQLVSEETAAELERRRVREELKQVVCSCSRLRDGLNLMDVVQMPLLSPWISYRAHEPSFTDELNNELEKRVHDDILDKLSSLQQRLEKLQLQRENSGVLPAGTLDTLLQSRLVVEAKRKVQPAKVAENVSMTSDQFERKS